MTNSIKNLEGVTPMTTQETKETKGGFFFLASLFGGFGKGKGGNYGGSHGGHGGNNCGCNCGR